MRARRAVQALYACVVLRCMRAAVRCVRVLCGGACVGSLCMCCLVVRDLGALCVCCRVVRDGVTFAGRYFLPTSTYALTMIYRYLWELNTSRVYEYRHGSC